MKGWKAFEHFVAMRQKGNAHKTALSVKAYIRMFKVFLDASGISDLRKVTDLDGDRFIQSFPSDLKPITVFARVRSVYQALVQFKQMYPRRVHYSVEFPKNITRPEHCSRENKEIRIELLGRIVTACIQDLEANVKNPIPYLLMLAIRTGINIGSLCSLKVGCLESAPDQTLQLVWDKPRARGQLRVKVSPTAWGPIEVIRQRETHANGSGMLFNFDGLSVTNTRPIWLAKWSESKGLPKFTFASIRPTIAAQIYKESKDIYAVQGFLQHKSINTTLLYLEQGGRTAANIEVLSPALAAMYGRVFNGI